MRPLIAFSAVSLALLASVPAFAMRVEVPGDRTRSCYDSKSPVILLKKVPAGTASLKIRIQNVSEWTDVPSTAIIPYRGDRIEKGAVRHFVRCPIGDRPFGKGATVEIRVQARDADGKVIATARDDAYYPAW